MYLEWCGLSIESRCRREKEKRKEKGKGKKIIFITLCRVRLRYVQPSFRTESRAQPLVMFSYRQSPMPHRYQSIPGSSSPGSGKGVELPVSISIYDVFFCVNGHAAFLLCRVFTAQLANSSLGRRFLLCIEKQHLGCPHLSF
jgi:hypothetical protein